jgi:hypothetical protein
MSTQVNLEPIVRGDTWTNLITVTDSAGVAINITGRVYWVTLKLDPTSADPGQAQSSATAAGAPAVAGQVTVTLSHTQTLGLAVGTYNYDIQEVNGATVTTLCYGKVKVIRDITVAIV